MLCEMEGKGDGGGGTGEGGEAKLEGKVGEGGKHCKLWNSNAFFFFFINELKSLLAIEKKSIL